jgi:hypothetical protein
MADEPKKPELPTHATGINEVVPRADGDGRSPTVPHGPLVPGIRAE